MHLNKSEEEKNDAKMFHWLKNDERCDDENKDNDKVLPYIRKVIFYEL
jgi:hypothetical protein